MKQPHWQGSDLERRAAMAIAHLLQDVPVGGEFHLASSDETCAILEYFLPALLRAEFPQWKGESLDGLFVARARRAGEGIVDLLGTCVLMSDQSVTPFAAAFEVFQSGVRSFDVSVGEAGGGALGISGPACNSGQAGLLLARLRARDEEGDVQWIYRVTSVAENPNG